ncbi:hypothetical protein E0H22_03690 [Rhodopseudomonas boonkerdii]|uniref:hypothetical protein n=1 Tax=Rhodopseudomonas boonkerdii TaxID=475937 RepID=UPI001E4734C6|nr:hypothetical protein [Rhodopseudomonas boonkerdii]UGV24858.1 hypothetical protein E0H22_03690 [Rhodopseudomonas boonkerdii]
MRVTNRFLQHSIAAFLLLMSASSALAEDSKSDPAAEQSFRSFHSIKAWAPRTQPIDIGDRAVWERHFPARTCTWRKQAIQAPNADIAIFSSCPAYVSSRRISFEFHGKAGDVDLYLKRVKVEGKELSLQEYENFIDHPFTSFGSYQTLLQTNDRMRVVSPAGARDITSIEKFLSTAENAEYSCFATDQSVSTRISIFCFVDAHDPEDAEYAAKHRPFIIDLQRADATWALRAIHMEERTVTEQKTMLHSLYETIGLDYR